MYSMVDKEEFNQVITHTEINPFRSKCYEEEYADAAGGFVLVRSQ